MDLSNRKDSKPVAGANKIVDTTAQTAKDYYERCSQYANEKINNKRVAKNIAANALLQLMEKLGWFNRAEIEGQVYTIIDNKCAEYIQEQEFLAKGALAFGEITPSDVAQIEAELSSLIYDELDRLPPQRKRVMLELYAQGLTSQEVCQRMVSETSAPNKIKQFLKRLCKK